MEEITRIGGIGEAVRIADARVFGVPAWRVCAVSPFGSRSEGRLHETEESARADYEARILFAASYR